MAPPPKQSEPAFTALRWAGRELRIETAWIAPAHMGAVAPTLVFLHEGLGSVSMWRDFPARLCAALGLRGLVVSRPGYGRSTPRAPGERWGTDFMHRQAQGFLPALRRALGLDAPVWLFGHSDGGTIALLHAAHVPDTVAGLVVLAPHIVVEEHGLASILQARKAYMTGELRARLARHHADPDSAFFGWSDAWLAPAFRGWTIEREIEAIRAPVLAIQGLDDEYGTLEQIRGIARRVPQTELLELPACGHSPHRDLPEAVIDATLRFVQRHSSVGIAR